MKKKTKNPKFPTFAITKAGMSHQTMAIGDWGTPHAIFFIHPKMELTVSGLPSVELKKLQKITINGVEFGRVIS